MFKYLLTINEKKYPEVVKKLNSVKEKDGIAIYIRHLIENDIRQKSSSFAQDDIPVIVEQAPELIDEMEPQSKPAKTKNIKFIDDVGGIF